MNKDLVFSLSLLLGVIVTLVLYFTIDNILLPFKSAPFYLIFLYIIIVFIIHLVHTIKWKLILQTTDNKISIKKLFAFNTMGYSINYLTPTAHIGGEPLKAAMLKDSKVPLADGVSSIFIDKSINLLADAIMVFIGLTIVLLSFAISKEEKLKLIVVSIICILAMLIGIFNFMKKGNSLTSIYNVLKLKKIKFFHKYEDILVKADENINVFFKNHKTTFFVSVILSFSMWFLMYIEYKILFLILDFNANILQLFVIISFVGLAYMIPIPTAIGVLELSQLTAFSILSLSAGLGIAASIMIRAKDSIITLIGLALISIKGLWGFK